MTSDFDFRLETVQIIFIVVAVSMGCFAIVLLFFGFLATGATRQNIYSGAKCIMGGRVSALFVSFIRHIVPSKYKPANSHIK
jgi:putative Mn2+ efflux pump MntP